MKKLGIIILSTALMTGLMGCGNEKKELVYMESYDWNITTIQSENGEIIGGYYEYIEEIEDKNATEIRLSCFAQDGDFTIEDYTNIDYYEGSYEIVEEKKETVIYNITIGENTGSAVTSITKEDDGSKTSTLVMTIDGYTLNFQAE